MKPTRWLVCHECGWDYPEQYSGEDLKGIAKGHTDSTGHIEILREYVDVFKAKTRLALHNKYDRR